MHKLLRDTPEDPRGARRDCVGCIDLAACELFLLKEEQVTRQRPVRVREVNEKNLLFRSRYQEPTLVTTRVIHNGTLHRILQRRDPINHQTLELPLEDPL